MPPRRYPGPMPKADRWARWLAERRFGSDAETRERVLTEVLYPIRDRVLDGAEPLPGQRVLDVGCGDGLIGFGALERGAREVVFSDISADVLRECGRRAGAEGMLDRCDLVRAPADDLGPIASGCVDVVTVRSVLIYVRSKQACFHEFARVLAPGGRLSLFEPINRFAQVEWTGDRMFGLDISAVADVVEKLRAVYLEAVPPETDPMLDFDERDLVAFAESAGFVQIDLTVTAEVRPADPVRWEVFVQTAGNPNVPTLAEAMDVALTASERGRLVAHLRPQIESGQATWRMAHAYLRALR
jgi:ubiquinone/menaquinone biosynthesis C-methylase UbiE